MVLVSIENVDYLFFTFVASSAAVPTVEAKEPQDLKSQVPSAPLEAPSSQPQQTPAPIPGTVPTQPQQLNHSTSPSENGIPVAATAEEVKERGPPKAMVKPQVLTHVISDFVIQESSEPFPVTRSSLMNDLKPSPPITEGDEPPSK